MASTAIRFAEVGEGIEELRSEISDWLHHVDEDGVEGAHISQLAMIENTFMRTLDAVAKELSERTAEGLDLGRAYDVARTTDKRVLFCRRLFRWYASRIDQRDVSTDTETTRDCLRAADEVIWSTWVRTFEAAGASRPAPPMPFIDNDSVPWASFHDALPQDTRPPVVDDFFKERIRSLPVSVIGLPPLVVRRPWWLVVAIHETGHHVQHVIHPGLVEATATALRKAALGAKGEPAEAEQWADWSMELFADAFAAVFARGAFIWVLEELERSTPSALVETRPTYPPAITRLAVTAAVIKAIDGKAPAFVLTDSAASVDAGKVAHLTERVHPIADALLDAPIGRTTLRSLGGSGLARAHAQARWVERFADVQPDPRPVKTVEAAVDCVAGAVEAWRQRVSDNNTPDPDRLRQRMLAVLPLCRLEGDRASAPIGSPAASLITALLDPMAPL